MKFNEYKQMVSDIKLDNFASLMNIGRKFKKIEDKENNLKVAFIGTASLQLTTLVTRALLTKYDIYADVYEGQFNGILMDTLDSTSDLYKFEPDYLVILPDYRDIIDSRPQILASKEMVEDQVGKVVNKYLNIFDKVHTKLPKCHIIFSNFVAPFVSPLGNLECNYIFSQDIYFKKVNYELVLSKPSYVTLIDMEGLAQYIGKENWFDEGAYYLNKSGYNLKYIGYVADLIARQFSSFLGKIKKCIVLDLDNTLWGGIVGDQGYNGINIDPNDAIGEAYIAFQKYIISLKERGIILAVCSKNEEENAKEPFLKNEKMLLKLEDFSLFIANWDDKASNIKRIAKDLNLGLDSFVFVDDNPTERELVKKFVPEVTVIDLPDDPALYIRAIDQAHAFEWNQITSEDITRSKSYVDNKIRENLLDECIDYDDYLEKLEINGEFLELNEENLPRFVQLTNKTNQFNLRTVRYNEAEIIDYMNDNVHKMYTISIKDKFSEYGIIACIILKFEDEECFIENWVMSCRVFKKTVEHYTMENIVRIALENGCKVIRGEYIQTEKNKLLANLYTELGFETEFENKYILRDLSNYRQKHFIKEEN